MLNKYKKNIYSQNGEDGILLHLLKETKILQKNKTFWCCEFGAWDGIHGSNTFNLVKNYNFKAVYIEGDKEKFTDLLKTKKKFPKIIAFNEFVSPQAKSLNSLDKILKRTEIVKNFDILSIDIDSFDLAVWKSLKNYHPKIVVIEINSGVVPGIKQIHSSKKQGNSFTSTVDYAKKNGYELVCHTGNCIFLERKILKKIDFEKKYIKNPELLFDFLWLKQKENVLKKIAKSYLPKFLLIHLRKIKRALF